MSTRFARTCEPVPAGGSDACAEGLRGRVALDTRQAEALVALDEFGPREALVARLGERPGLAPGRAGRVLDELIERGLVAPAIDHLGPARSFAPLADPLIVIREHGRQQSLQRLFVSLLADEQRFAVRRRYLVVDDAPDAATSAAIATLVREFASRTRSRVFLLDPAARERCVARWRAFVPAARGDGISELFDRQYARCATGARAWNLGVLAAAGGGLSFVDNDTTFPLRRAPDASASYEPFNSLWSFTRYVDDGQFDVLPRFDAEPYAWIASHVGASARTLVERHGWHEALLDGQPADALAHCRGGAPVLAAFGGVYGGLAYNSTAWLNTGIPEDLAPLWQAPYRHARLEGDALMHGTLAPRLVDQAFYAPMLCDARELLPFAGTRGIADDTFFLGLLGAMVREPLFAYLPTLLGHFPVEGRSRLQRSLEPLLLDRNSLVRDLFATSAKRLAGDDRRARLAAIGRDCGALATATDAELDATVLGWRRRYVGNLVKGIANALEDAPDAPAEWRAHATRVREVNLAALDATVLDAADRADWRALLEQVELAADAWPRIWDDVRERPLLEGLALE